MNKRKLLFALSAKSKNLYQRVKEVCADPVVLTTLSVLAKTGQKASETLPLPNGWPEFRTHSLNIVISPLMGLPTQKEQIMAQLKGLKSLMDKERSSLIADMYELDFKNDR